MAGRLMSSLQSRRLGRTGLDVTVLGFGAMELRGSAHRLPRPIDPQVAARLLNAVLDSGINFIDTSIDYGDSERYIGSAISHRRGEFVLASKCGCPLDADRWVQGYTNSSLPHDYSPKNLADGVEQSLRRLKTDVLDIVQLHVSPSAAELERLGSMEALCRLRDEGKVRFIGISSELPNIVDHLGMDQVDTIQLEYSALNRELEGHMATASAAGQGVIVRGSVAQGEPGVGRATSEVWSNWERAGLDDLLDGMTRQELMLRYALSNPHVHTAIVGTASLAHLASNVRAAQRGPLPPELYAAVVARLDAPASRPGEGPLTPSTAGGAHDSDIRG
jgi:aryl-alcohol dehydrogenase-like predicted oxidoreductase